MSKGRYSAPKGVTDIEGMESLQRESLDRPGFTTKGYIDKKGTPSLEAGAPIGEIGYIFNKMPPGMDISNQECVVINDMPFKKIVDMSYPGDGAFPFRDVPE